MLAHDLPRRQLFSGDSFGDATSFNRTPGSSSRLAEPSASMTPGHGDAGDRVVLGDAAVPRDPGDVVGPPGRGGLAKEFSSEKLGGPRRGWAASAVADYPRRTRLGSATSWRTRSATRQTGAVPSQRRERRGRWAFSVRGVGRSGEKCRSAQDLMSTRTGSGPFQPTGAVNGLGQAKYCTSIHQCRR